jgi:hypothetical protein
MPAERHPLGRTCRDPLTIAIVILAMPYALGRLALDTTRERNAMKKHKGNGTGNADQGAGRRRGPETGNGFTASTGRGKPGKVVMQGPAIAGKASRLRAIADVFRGKHSK